MEYRSIAPIWNCTPRPRGWERYQGAKDVLIDAMGSLGHRADPTRERNLCNLRNLWMILSLCNQRI
jgi:hypothetical protein